MRSGLRSGLRFFGLIPAAGSGSRVGSTVPKQYLALAGRPLIAHAIAAFGAVAAIERTIVVVARDDAHFEELRNHDAVCRAATVVAVGGATRGQSVRNGLEAMRGFAADDDWVLVHDAARPGITARQIEMLIAALRDDDVGGLFALPLVDTLKRATGDPDLPRVAETLDRASLWQAQTPQMFRYAMLCRALDEAARRGLAVTDEAAAIEALGHKPRLIAGSARNLKVTTAEDVAIIEALLANDGGRRG